MTVVTLPGTVDGSPLSTTFTVAAADASLFPGDPGSDKCCYGLCHQGGMDQMASRAAQLASDVGQSGPLYPKSGRTYVVPFDSIATGITLAKKALSDAALVKAWGGLPFIDTKEWTALDYTKVGLGQMDQYIDFLIEGLATLDWPTILGYHQEPVGDTVGGTVETGVPGAKAYGSALDRFEARRVLAGATKVTITGCIGFGAFPSATGAGKFGTVLPWFQYAEGASGVRGSHKYLQYESQDEAKWSKGWSMDQLFGQFWDLQDSVDSAIKARAHGEWGVHTRAANLATAPAFMDEFLTYFIGYRGRVSDFFDSGNNVNAGGAWTLDCPIQGGSGVIDISRRVKFAQQLLDPRVAGPSLLAA